MAQTSSSQFSPAERRNWGYWDGKAARERGRYPEWAKSYNHCQKHPIDQQYGKGFWAGWYDQGHPNSKAA